MTVVEVTHPLVRHKLGLLRDVSTSTEMFRRLVNELTLLLSYEATKELALEETQVQTPIEWTTAQRIPGKKIAVCPILRAGMGMLDGVLSLIPVARVGFIGLYRNEETLQPVEYFVKLPADIADRDVLLLDPMLATGNSTAAAVDVVKKAGATGYSTTHNSRMIPLHRGVHFKCAWRRTWKEQLRVKFSNFWGSRHDSTPIAHHRMPAENILHPATLLQCCYYSTEITALRLQRCRIWAGVNVAELSICFYRQEASAVGGCRSIKSQQRFSEGPRCHCRKHFDG